MKSILTSTTTMILALALSTGIASAKKPAKSPPPQKKADPVESYMKQHDRNHDGVIDSSEMSAGEIAKGDVNKDGKLDRSEVTKMLGKK